MQLCWSEKTGLLRISSRYFLPWCIFLWLCFLHNCIITTANLSIQIQVLKKRRKAFLKRSQKISPGIVWHVIFWRQATLWFRKNLLFSLKTIPTKLSKLFLYRKKYGLRPNLPFNSAVHPLFRNLCSSGATVLRKQHYFVLGICKNTWAYLKY